MNYNSGVIPWWYSQGSDPLSCCVTKKGCATLPRLPPGQRSKAGCSWNCRVFCLHVRGGRNLKAKWFLIRKKCSLPSVPTKHMIDLLWNVKYCPSLTLPFAWFLNLTGEIPCLLITVGSVLILNHHMVCFCCQKSSCKREVNVVVFGRRCFVCM